MKGICLQLMISRNLALRYADSCVIMKGLRVENGVDKSFIDFEEVEHTADWALRVRGRDFRGLLVNAARGGIVDEEALAGRTVSDRVHEVDHLLGDRVGRSEVAS